MDATTTTVRTTFLVCQTCGGHGSTWKFGQLKLPRNATTCPRCEGAGEVVGISLVISSLAPLTMESGR